MAEERVEPIALHLEMQRSYLEKTSVNVCRLSYFFPNIRGRDG